MKELLYGRELLWEEIPESLREHIINDADREWALKKTASYTEKNGKKYCQRCQSLMVPVEASYCVCEQPCAYCRNCLKMGKVRACNLFYSLPEENAFEKPKENVLAWEGTLSPQQEEASESIIATIAQNETRLLWAVAGAGKTEMLFSGIEQALKAGKRVCIASPRVDVCLELAPRLEEAFPKTSLTVLYGDMDEPYAYTQLVIATTHQLFRFREAFDVLIIDEIDAFPFHLDDSLKFGASKARKETSALVHLSATPDQAMQKDVARKKLKATILPARYHGRPLPVPQAKLCLNWRKKVLKKPLKTSFGKAMDQRIKKGKRFLVFVPNIAWMLAFEEVLRQLYPEISFATVSAEDPERKEKIIKMRQDELQFLITSTILERGVTFPNVDVLVIGAEDRVFTESALVQIAGRCGRSPQYPTGDVLFFHNGKSRALKKAIKQIKKMNRLAKEKGLIK